MKTLKAFFSKRCFQSLPKQLDRSIRNLIYVCQIMIEGTRFLIKNMHFLNFFIILSRQSFFGSPPGVGLRDQRNLIFFKIYLLNKCVFEKVHKKISFFWLASGRNLPMFSKFGSKICWVTDASKSICGYIIPWTQIL